MTTTESTGLDREALRERYRAERDKRLRADGPDQYVEMTGRYGHYIEDPYVEVVPREPLTDEVTVALIGGGFAGLVTAARLVQAGITDVRIIEKGGDFGGTWYWNRYPGAQCDVESYIYLPLLEETGYVPKEKYSHAPEIQEHCRRLGEHFGLYDNACLSTEVTGLEWDDAASRWIIRTNRGDAMRAQYVVIGGGPLHRPKLPGIPGHRGLRGPQLPHQPVGLRLHRRRHHSAGSTACATSGSGIIGTGATAVQVVPHLAEACEQLYVFQRTPSSIDVRGNRPTDPEWAASLQPGWQAERIANFTALTGGGYAAEDLVMDGWTDIIGRIVTMLRQSGEMSADAIAAALEESDFQKMDDIRARVRRARRGPGHRRGAEALVQALLQAAVLPRRLPAELQPAERAARRHRRQGRRPDHAERGRGRRHRVRDRLPHLRHRLRGEHRLHAEARLRPGRSRRREPVGALGERHAHDARHARARLPQPVPHRARPGRVHGQLPAPARGVRQADRATSSPRPATAAPTWSR